MLRRLLDDAAEAEDVLQQSYLRALEKLDTVRDQERLRQWFERLVRNAALDRIRRRRAATRALASLSRGVPEVTQASAGDDRPCRCATRLLGVLPARYAEVLERVYIEEGSIELVARRLQTTPNNLRVRLHRARGALRQQLVSTCEGCTDSHFASCACGKPRTSRGADAAGGTACRDGRSG
jgi:RNA polymerase sigma-70 factor (ECF subfamily)